MSDQENVNVVKGLFADFGRGDVAGVLGRLTEDVEWRLAGPTELTYAGIHRGRDQVAQFFKLLADTAEFELFEPQEYIAQGNKVVTLGHYTGKTKNGGSFDSDFVMVFTLRNGKVVAFQEFLDSAAYNAAFASVPA